MCIQPINFIPTPPKSGSRTNPGAQVLYITNTVVHFVPCSTSSGQKHPKVGVVNGYG